MSVGGSQAELHGPSFWAPPFGLTSTQVGYPQQGVGDEPLGVHDLIILVEPDLNLCLLHGMRGSRLCRSSPALEFWSFLERRGARGGGHSSCGWDETYEVFNRDRTAPSSIAKATAVVGIGASKAVASQTAYEKVTARNPEPPFKTLNPQPQEIQNSQVSRTRGPWNPAIRPFT